MELGIILFICGILGYVIYYELPNPKFKKANLLFNIGAYDKAISILETIFLKHSEAPSKLAECKLKQGQEAKDSNDALICFKDAIEIGKRLPKKADKKKYQLVEAKAQYEIALIQFKNTPKTVANEIKINNLQLNLQFIDSVTNYGVESDFEKLKISHYNELAKLYFDIGLKSEKETNYQDAIIRFKNSKDYAINASLSEIRYNAAVRIGICKLKEKPKDVEFVSYEEYNKADKIFVHDFFYRYVIYLLKKESYTAAESILKAQLNLPTQTIEQLKELLETKQISHAVRKVEEINRTIDLLYEKEFPISEVEVFYENLDLRISEIRPVIPNIATKLQAVKPSLFNRLLSHYISSGQFGEGLKLIQDFPKFWESPELLKNMGICCYGFTENGNISDKNYRTIISNWLTSVFSDQVILNSLESTSWDDNLTFTLIDSVGPKYFTYSELPENVNFDDITETNISIGETQRELIQQFENLLNRTISDPSLSKNVHEFYNEEKEALERILSIIATEVVFATPHFAKKYGLNEKIIKELDNDYVEYSNEESLEAGLPYLKSNADTYVLEYAAAKKSISSMVIAIQNENLKELKSLTTQRKKALVEKYYSINELLEDNLFRVFAAKIESNEDNENIIPLMDECISFCNENSKLLIQCSTYIHNYCEFNWKTKSSHKLLELMIKSIKYNPNNYRAAKTLTILINNSLMEIANNNTNSSLIIYSLIDEVKTIRSQVLKDALKELIPLRKKVLDSIGKDAAKQITIGYNLNSNGIKLKKILDTMQILGGS